MSMFNIEVTDTFGGEANYSWVRRYTYKAKSFRGALQKMTKEHGGYWRKDFDCGDMVRYNMIDACICCFITYSEGN